MEEVVLQGQCRCRCSCLCAHDVFSDRPCFQGVGAVRQDPQQMKRCHENLKTWKA